MLSISFISPHFRLKVILPVGRDQTLTEILPTVSIKVTPHWMQPFLSECGDFPLIVFIHHKGKAGSRGPFVKSEK